MVESQVSISRKRPRLGQLTPTSEPPPKRQKSNESAHHPAPEFWDNLSTVWLTRRALRELGRRNHEASIEKSTSLARSQSPRRNTRSSNRRWLEEKVRQCACQIPTSSAGERLRKLRTFARHGGPDLSDLRGYKPLPSECIMNQRRTRLSKKPQRSRDSTTPGLTTGTTTTKKSSPYDRDFEQHLTDHHTYQPAYRFPDGRRAPKPENWDEINAVLARPRPSLSPSRYSDGAYERFVDADADAKKEAQIRTNVIPIIEGTIEDARTASGQIPFNNLQPLTDGNLVAGNPDVFYGARPEQLDRRIRTELSGTVVPSTQHDLPIAPNFFLEGKGPEGSTAVAKRQATYDGALGARAIRSLQTYRQDAPEYDHKAYTVTSTYHDGQLKMYTTHVGSPTTPGGNPQYFTTQMKGWSLTGDAETFHKGIAAYRNARDWAKEQRDAVIRQANERLTADSMVNAASAELSFTSTTSMDLDPVTMSFTIECTPDHSHSSQLESPAVPFDYQPHSDTSPDEYLSAPGTATPHLPLKRPGSSSPREHRRKK